MGMLRSIQSNFKSFSCDVSDKLLAKYLSLHHLRRDDASDHISTSISLAVEEPEVVTVAIRPGVVDTEMQSQIATVHSSSMDQEDSKRFSDMRNEGKMLRPEQPGNVMARLVLDAPIEISGQFLK